MRVTRLGTFGWTVPCGHTNSVVHSFLYFVFFFLREDVQIHSFSFTIQYSCRCRGLNPCCCCFHLWSLMRYRLSFRCSSKDGTKERQKTGRLTATCTTWSSVRAKKSRHIGRRICADKHSCTRSATMRAIIAPDGNHAGKSERVASTAQLRGIIQRSSPGVAHRFSDRLSSTQRAPFAAAQ